MQPDWLVGSQAALQNWLVGLEALETTGVADPDAWRQNVRDRARWYLAQIERPRLAHRIPYLVRELIRAAGSEGEEHAEEWCRAADAWLKAERAAGRVTPLPPTVRPQ